ncbi:MAG: adenosylcobinamide-GDP ribazoletransferase, partial [Gemmatimonadetes bacterium]|nr:adenosylcobinamide-GDP ribazoletransferase [Gemmatimonadota bacterium]
PLRLLGILAAAGVTVLGTARFLAGRFGGVTGDVCGAVGEAVELVVLGGLLRWSVA